MKNIFGTTEKIKLRDKNGVLRYKYSGHEQHTYNSNGNQLTFENSNGNWHKYTYDSDGNVLTYKDAYGYWAKRTYDSMGNELTYENSNGEKRGFDTPEYTMEELTKKLGHDFKIKN